MALDEHGDIVMAPVASGPAVEAEAEAEAYEYEGAVDEDSEEEQVIYEDPFADGDPFDGADEDDDDL